MSEKFQFWVIFIIFLLTIGSVLYAQNDKCSSSEPPSKLAVLWTSGDRDVAIKMVFMYTFNAKKRGWWNDIQFIVWGPSSKLLSEDLEIQDYRQWSNTNANAAAATDTQSCSRA